ncbi:FG-GAP-like repeat-containing protein, partial [Catellatospora tritici]|uniref:FG-GAP-like repeat-containing protein n=1 Tax=Catellatospora tritici TaxID=2851566 RepID=UPI003558EEEE|nr:hypothetical protein [Catellatospora tritici]
DLIAVNGSTDYGHFYLSYYPNSNMVGGYAMGYDIAVNTPDGDQNWQNWDITTTRLPTGTAMYLRNTVTGALRLWTGITVTTNDATFTATIAYTTHTVTVTGLGATATVQAADIDGNGTADLWSTSGGVTTPRLVTAISDPAGTATLTAQATIPLVTAAHAWTLADMGSAVAGAPITTAADVVGSLNLAAAGGATWNTGDLFSPDAQLNGVSGTLVTTGPAVATNADFSVSLWAKPTGGGTVLSQDGNNAAGFKLWAEPSDKSWRFAMSQSDVASPVWDTAIAPPGSASYGVWSQITVTYKAATNTVVLYLNGVDVATTGHSVKWNATGALRVGAHRSGAGAVGGWFGGQVAQVQTWHTEIIASGTLSFAYNWYDDGPGWNTWNSITVVDVDNDGKADVAGRYNDHLWFKLSTSSSSAVSFGGWLDFGGGWNTWDNIGFADVTGDGKPELLGRYNDHLWYKVNTSTATAISFGSAWYDDGAGWNAATVIKVVDVNADGRADVMRRYNDHIWFKLSTSTGGTVSFGGWQDLGGGWNTWDNVQAADVTGDGKPELIGRYNNHMWYKINTTVGSSVSFADDWFDDGVGWNTWDWITVVDVNHDGKADVVGRTVDHLWIKLSTSSASTIGFSNVWEDLGTGWNARDYVQAADVTGDGRPELVSRYGDHMWYKINTSTI